MLRNPMPIGGYPDIHKMLAEDLESLRLIVDGLRRLETKAMETLNAVDACNRGYFTPAEEDSVMRLVFAFRSYRFGLYEIIQHYLAYEQIADAELRLRAFSTGYAAALFLYGKSFTMLHVAETRPILRRKLNEENRDGAMSAGFLDEVVDSYSSIFHQRLLRRAQRFWHSQRTLMHSLRASDPDWRWLSTVIRRQRGTVRRAFQRVVHWRVRHDWKALWRMVFKPIGTMGGGLGMLFAGRVARKRPSNKAAHAIDAALLNQLSPLLRPGDILLIRAEGKLTTSLLPGFWAHAAIYVGGAGDAERMGMHAHPLVKERWPALRDNEPQWGWVIEAVSPKVAIHPLDYSLRADHVAVLRAPLDSVEMHAVLDEACSHLGKPYDFKFDFNISSRIVCTELIYRAFHGRAKITFDLVKRLGRYSLCSDDIARQATRAHEGGGGPMEVVALAVRDGASRMNLLEGAHAVRGMELILGGLRPTAVWDFARRASR